MVCGNKEHLDSVYIHHTCTSCQYWNVHSLSDTPKTEVCKICKSGDCQWTISK